MWGSKTADRTGSCGWARGNDSYVGEVEYGFARDERAVLGGLLKAAVRSTTPFEHATRHISVVHVEPVVRVAVQFQCWSDGRLRHPIYRGLAS